ncbi:hypothetical protein Cantr_02807 [Candida viswanathii]|uniref:Uncharacterized protein n=1 Tax=Candida viswanathii TaxID=5486 RepID=A0A367YNW6_9ASCO|nr:hypothetical protein Cantr_02807 [Candida viswanathii]
MIPCCFLLLILLSLVYCLPDQSQSCITNERIPFTGYKVEYQLNLQNFHGEYHLLYCNDNKLLYDRSLNETIPWTIPINFSTSAAEHSNTFILARRKSFALRSLPIFMPNTLIGSLYYGDDLDNIQFKPLNKSSVLKSIPLMASNIFRNWVELDYKLNLIYHVPILTTPSVDSKRFNFGFFESNKLENNWDKYISALEDYSYNYDSRVMMRQMVDKALDHVNFLINTSKLLRWKFDNADIKKNNVGAKLWWKVILLSKVLKEDMFASMVEKFDTVFKY